MKDWLSARGFWDTDGAQATLAAVLLVLLLVTLPRERIGALRRPAGALALYLAFFGLAQALPAEHARWIRVAAFTTALYALSRTALLVATETRLGRWVLPPLPRILLDVLNGLLMALVVLATLHAAGFEPGQLLTTSALLTAVVGFALQDTLGNLFAGLSLQLGRQFDVGDWIDIDTDPAKNGRVIEIGWRATKVLTHDAVEIVVPNGVISNAPVRVYTRPMPIQRRRIPFGCAYAASPGRVRAVVLAAMEDLDHVLEDPAPDVVARGFGDSAVNYELRYWTEDHALVQETDSEVLERIWHALGRAGIAIPFPQREVHLFQRDAEHHRDAERQGRGRRVRALENVPMFGRLPAELLEELAAEAADRTYAAGERIVREGEAGSELFVVVEGDVSVLTGDPEHTVATLGPGGFFGEMSLLTGERRSATVRARSETALVVVGHDGLRRLLRRHPELDATLSALMAERQVQLEAASEGGRDDGDHEDLTERSGVLLRRIQGFFGR